MTILDFVFKVHVVLSLLSMRMIFIIMLIYQKGIKNVRINKYVEYIPDG